MSSVRFVCQCWTEMHGQLVLKDDASSKLYHVAIVRVGQVQQKAESSGPVCGTVQGQVNSVMTERPGGKGPASLAIGSFGQPELDSANRFAPAEVRGELHTTPKTD
eukprot:TRINITY_DN66498_c6_g11_i1.p2 TRINITY_DN66498_c6_g11~~TRINITY_DN66498_c6_g11_i1.p2  ORF type:complete len:106 (+),score=2.91 TRINITY_DN66498_c6_g11_i1:328-645(+)